MVVSSPGLLPLSGSPRLTVIGREIPLSPSGYVDALAVEPDGRPVVIEVKLRTNSESRRAVVSQALSHAASLHGRSAEDFEVLVSRHLDGVSLHEFVRASVQEESVAADAFAESLAEHLRAGSFRVVIVLDDAPPELVNLVGYVEAVTSGVSIDLIGIHAYGVGERRIAVPRRIDPGERDATPAPPLSQSHSGSRGKGVLEPGVEPFRRRISDALPQYQPTLALLADWVDELAAVADVVPETYMTVQGDVALLPRYRDTRVGLVSIWRYADGRPAMSLWRPVLDKRTPGSIPEVEALIAPNALGQRRQVYEVSAALLGALRRAYLDGRGTSQRT